MRLTAGTLTEVWITKHLFTKGLYSRKCLVSDTYTHLCSDPEQRWGGSFRGNEWHKTREAAVNHAMKMIARRKKMLAKQAAFVESLEAELAPRIGAPHA